jgi:CheY-like chemotaxis protein
LPTVSADRRWLGPVAMWGTVIEHKSGFRASHAYPLALEEVAPSSVLDGIREATVLFVESDEVIRDLGMDMLRRRGCRVFAAANACEAHAALTRHALRIDVVIAGTGESLADVQAVVEYAEKTRPEAAVVANSGRFLVLSLDGRRAGIVQRPAEAADPFAHPLARAYGIPAVSRGHWLRGH